MNSQKLVGFTAGTFDMFHIGHLNLLRNARARCDYLIVGVNSDDLVEEYKGRKVIVPLDERIEIVRSICFVDEVMKIETLDKMVSWEQKHYHLLFIGDDWKGDPRWEATAKEMADIGVQTIFLPYTKGRNSTLLREALIGCENDGSRVL